MLKIKPVRGALALLLAVSLCLAMSLTAFLIDTPAMREHAEQADQREKNGQTDASG